VVAVERLTKRYGRQVAVDDLTFSLDRGMITGFLGPNGAGKTTTMPFWGPAVHQLRLSLAHR